jgi:hypothetical protein
MHITRDGEQGAALVTVLLFTVLTFILISSMLAVAGNEIFISALQRDGVRALDLAQAGLQEAVRRIEEDRPYRAGFTSSLSPNASVTVTQRVGGSSSAYLEVASTAVAGRATRRLTTLVLAYGIGMPPNILFGNSIEEFGQSNVSSGDIYARTFVQFREGEVTSGLRTTYAGWRTSRCVDPEKAPTDACKPAEYPAKIPPCYTHKQCVELNAGAQADSWYPGTRHAESDESTIGADVKAQTLKCPAGGGGTLPPDTVPGGAKAATAFWNGAAWVPEANIGGQPLYGFDRDDRNWQGTGIPPQAVSAKLPCGLPYKWVQQTFPQEKSTEPVVTRWIKTVVFEQWFDNYWQFDPAQMTVTKKTNLTTYPEMGAIPPLPAVSGENADITRTGGGVLDESSGFDWGCKSPEMACSPAVDRPKLIFLNGGDWNITGNVFGHGTIIVNGNLQITGNFEYWGTIIVDGTVDVTLGAGNVKVHGGVASRTKTKLGGNTLVEGGTNIPSALTGRAAVIGKAWWER